MALGRALRQVLIINSGKPCNIQTPNSHNFITQDGKTPKEISNIAGQQVEKYDTVIFFNGLAITGLAIIADICKGNLDPQKLARHRHGNCRKSYDEIAKALKGNNRKDYLFGLKQEYESYLFFQKKIDKNCKSND